MTPEPPTPTPRRTRRFFLWLGVLLLVFSAWRGWKEYDYRAAVKEAKALGWRFTETSPLDDIKKDWHAAFRMETWAKSRRSLWIGDTNGFNGHDALVLRLNPQEIFADDCLKSVNLSYLKHLPDLRILMIRNFPEMTDANMDQMGELTELRALILADCPRLTHLNPFIKLKKLNRLIGTNMPLIPTKDIDAVQAAHPDTKVAIRP